MSDFIDIGDHSKCMIIFSRQLSNDEVYEIREKFAEIIKGYGVKYIFLGIDGNGVLFGKPIFECDGNIIGESPITLAPITPAS